MGACDNVPAARCPIYIKNGSLLIANQLAA